MRIILASGKAAQINGIKRKLSGILSVTSCFPSDTLDSFREIFFPKFRYKCSFNRCREYSQISPKLCYMIQFTSTTLPQNEMILFVLLSLFLTRGTPRIKIGKMISTVFILSCSELSRSEGCFFGVS